MPAPTSMHILVLHPSRTPAGSAPAGASVRFPRAPDEAVAGEPRETSDAFAALMAAQLLPGGLVSPGESVPPAASLGEVEDEGQSGRSGASAATEAAALPAILGVPGFVLPGGTASSSVGEGTTPRPALANSATPAANLAAPDTAALPTPLPSRDALARALAHPGGDSPGEEIMPGMSVAFGASQAQTPESQVHLPPAGDATGVSPLPPAVLVDRSESVGGLRFHVAAPLAQPGFAPEFAQKIVWLAGQGREVASIEISPPHLGPIEVRLILNHDQASAVFASPHASVREVLEAALPRLRELFAEAGLDLAHVDVSAQGFGQRAQGDEGEGTDRGDRGRVLMDAAVVPADSGGGRRGQGLLDVFA